MKATGAGRRAIAMNVAVLYCAAGLVPPMLVSVPLTCVCGRCYSITMPAKEKTRLFGPAPVLRHGDGTLVMSAIATRRMTKVWSGG